MFPFSRQLTRHAKYKYIYYKVHALKTESLI